MIKVGFTCGVCNDYFLTTRGLNTHIGRMHKGVEFPFMKRTDG